MAVFWGLGWGRGSNAAARSAAAALMESVAERGVGAGARVEGSEVEIRGR